MKESKHAARFGRAIDVPYTHHDPISAGLGVDNEAPYNAAPLTALVGRLIAKEPR